MMLNLIQHLSTKTPRNTEIPAQGRNDGEGRVFKKGYGKKSMIYSKNAGNLFRKFQ